MIRLGKVWLLGWLLATSAIADSWSVPQMQVEMSADGNWIARLYRPDKFADPTEKSLVTLFRFNGEHLYSKEYEYHIPSNTGPIRFILTNKGKLLTLGRPTPFSTGYELALYDTDGRLIKGYTGKDLFSGDQYAKYVSTSIYADHGYWLCVANEDSYISNVELLLRHQLGYFSINVDTGQLVAAEYGIGSCE